MPVPGQTFRVNPLDLDENIAIGISLPFNGTSVFNPTYSTKDQVKYNLINLLLTNKGERVMNPSFGSDIKKYVFEFITSENTDGLRQLILNSIAIYIPQINVISVVVTPEADFNTINIQIQYQMKLSGDKDSVTIQFQ